MPRRDCSESGLPARVVVAKSGAGRPTDTAAGIWSEARESELSARAGGRRGRHDGGGACACLGGWLHPAIISTARAGRAAAAARRDENCRIGLYSWGHLTSAPQKGYSNGVRFCSIGRELT